MDRCIIRAAFIPFRLDDSETGRVLFATRNEIGLASATPKTKSRNLPHQVLVLDSHKHKALSTLCL
jgi:hypothetical protein